MKHKLLLFLLILIILVCLSKKKETFKCRKNKTKNFLRNYFKRKNNSCSKKN